MLLSFVTNAFVTRKALIRAHTSAKEYVLVCSVKLVHHFEMKLITKIISIIVLTLTEQYVWNCAPLHPRLAYWWRG